MRNTPPLRVGDVLHGYCGGYFGRDSYDDKRVEAIGADWVVARDETGTVYFHNGRPEVLVKFRDDDGEQLAGETP